ncbi:MAG TPA: GntG family PLP-dependent aldolase [Bacteroidia bacterium]|jgi:threonine aldolase|nr:GntG family PLP-dependent aldolase [Bacteroidia bacterium]HRG51709.1 GntG family PLP-dependent aldolase [Bacteroidia bacterium]
MIIDLRSDTVTKPTQGMLEAMFKAEVGDDVFGEEPTVNALEQKAAKLFGMEAALFCPSGTMTNQIAINVHTRPGDEVLCDVTSHIYNYEGGGIASNSGVQAQLIQGDEGRISAQQVVEHIKPIYDWMTRTTLVSIENTGNKAGGSYYSLQQMKELSDICKKHQLNYHLDGARVFNAIVENNYSPADLGKLFDSISICLSKGLGAPVGSLLLGNKEFIRKARRVRKVFGGGMRQAGYLAAAGIYALDNHVERLKEDHQRAKLLEKIVSKLDYVDNVIPVYTNIVIFNLKKDIQAQAYVEKLAAAGIKSSGFGKQAIRFVTHLDYTDDMLGKTEEILKKI